MYRIEVTDNHVPSKESKPHDRAEIEALFPLSGRPIKDLCKEKEGLIIFPQCIKKTDDRVGDSPIFSIVGTADKDKVQLQTGNIMGYVGIGNVQLKIKSRFDEGVHDHFLHYMLQKVMHFNLFDMKTSNTDEDVFDFTMFMFPFFLKNALRQGLYREYRRFAHNDSNVKGAIDVNAHIRKNTPFAGRIAYNTREYSYDNSTNELIRHTIEYISTKRFGKTILGVDRETAEGVKLIIEQTPTYCKQKRADVILQNLRNKVHPYYTNYLPLRSLCLQILRNEEVKYGENDNEVYGILFDGAWLWEEYVNVVLKGKGFIHAENKAGKKPIYLFLNKKGVRYPDFYKNDFVLDAKYKRIGDKTSVSDIDRNDVHQVLAYMFTLNAPRGGLVAPLRVRQESVPSNSLTGNQDWKMSIFGIEISKQTDYKLFVEEMAQNEKVFLESLEL